MTHGFSKRYPDSPPPIKTISDFIEVLQTAYNGSYDAHKRLRHIESGTKQHQAECRRAAFLRKVNQIEFGLSDVRRAIETGDEAAEAKANAKILSIYYTMSEADQQQAWASIVKLNFCGNIQFLLNHYSGSKKTTD